jgi:hypothetical protein
MGNFNFKSRVSVVIGIITISRGFQPLKETNGKQNVKISSVLVLKFA